MSKIRKCTNSIQVPFEISADQLVRSIALKGWIMSLVTTPDAPEPAQDVLCPTCAKVIYGPELYARSLVEVRNRAPLPSTV
jgi:hypothetical protein